MLFSHLREVSFHILAPLEEFLSFVPGQRAPLLRHQHLCADERAHRRGPLEVFLHVQACNAYWLFESPTR